MKKKTISVITICLVVLMGIAIWFSNSGRKSTFEATIVEIQNRSCIVEPVEGSFESKSSDKIAVAIEKIDASIEPEVGDIIEITYNGDIMETYPARLGEVYRIKVVKEASEQTLGEGANEENIFEDEMAEEDKDEEMQEQEVHLVRPLPVMIDLDNLTECTLAVSLVSGDIYREKGGNGEVRMKVMVYDYELFDMLDVSLLEVGSILEINKEQVEITSIERNDLGNICINGGLDVGGYELHTDENGVYYSIGYSDVKTYFELGEVELTVSPDFVYTDASDLDNGERNYTVEDLLRNSADVDYSGTSHNISIVVESGVVVSMKRTYMP